MAASLIEERVAAARSGAFRAVLPELLGVAADPQADPDEAWRAAAAAIQILAWQDRSAEAADLAESLIARDGPLGGGLCDQDVPFVNVFHDAEPGGGPPAVPRLAAAAARVPEGRQLRKVLERTADDLRGTPAADLDRRYFAWGDPVRPVDDQVIGGDLLASDFSGLTPRQKRVFWSALHQTSDFPRARQVHRDTGELPEQYDLLLWMAGWYAWEGAVPSGEELLLAAHARWWPYQAWDTLPTVPAVNPYLRPVCTDRVREYYLTRPIGPEAEKATPA